MQNVPLLIQHHLNITYDRESVYNMTIYISQYNHNANKTICKYHTPSTNVLFDYFQDMLGYVKKEGVIEYV